MCTQPAPNNTTELLERVFERPLRFNESELARSVSHAGDVMRLRQALGKLLRGAQRWRPQPRLSQLVFSACT